MLLLWHGLPAYRSRSMLDWVASQRDWLSIEPLPGYAPDLNRTQQVWGNVNSSELANWCADSIGEVTDLAEDGLDRISSDAELCLLFSVTPVCAYDITQPAIARASSKGMGTFTSGGIL